MLKPKKNEIRKPTKTISGITPVAVMLPPRKCDHGCCIYCPNLDVPQSYTPKSPVVMRAREVDYDSFKQVQARLQAFMAMNHPTDKIELIIMGGTFLQYPEKFQYEFIKGCYDGLNEKKPRTLGTHKNIKARPKSSSISEIKEDLEQAKKLNEKAKHRCVALCIETRPDVCSEYIERMREFGCTRVELGVQIIDDKIYKKIKRGHSVKDVVEATKNLKNAGFKIGYHIMLGLLGSNLEKDLKFFKKLFSDERFKPDQLKIYPCQVISGSELEKVYWKGEYRPYTQKQLEKLIVKLLKLIPRYCRVMRIMREIPPNYLVAGVTRIDLRKDLELNLRKERVKLDEIRYREIGFALQHGEKVNTDLKLKITKYSASGGEEFFLEIVNKNDILFGLLRLRINYKKTREPTRFKGDRKTREHRFARDLALMRIIPRNRSAIVRELHVYGPALKLGEEGRVGQHTGLGKWLMSEAEKIVKKEGIGELNVISGVGVREYYKQLGYKLEKEYMVKKI